MKRNMMMKKKESTVLCYHDFHKLTLDFHDYGRITSRKNQILIFIFLILVYIGIQLGLLGVNFKSQEFIEDNYYLPFHILEFWAVFCFTILESFILISTNSITLDDNFNILQMVLVLFNVISTLCAAIVFSMFPTTYEVPAHYMEYCLQILITMIDFMFVIKGQGGKNSGPVKCRGIKMIFAVLTLALSVIQILIYGNVIQVPMEPERAGHFCEFSNEIANALFALLYGFQMYTEVNQELVNNEIKIRKCEIV